MGACYKTNGWYPLQQFIAFLIFEIYAIYKNRLKGLDTTPDSVAKLAKKLLRIKPNETILDLCWGDFSFIVKAFADEPNAVYRDIEIENKCKVIAEMCTDLSLGVRCTNIGNATNKSLEFLNKNIPGLPRKFSFDWLFATTVINNL